MPAGRINLVTNATMPPGSCGICGKGDVGNGFVDPQLDFEFYGVLYFCEDCVSEMARLYGMCSSAEKQQMINWLTDADTTMKKLRETLKSVEEFNSALLDDLNRLRANNSSTKSSSLAHS